jgi:hypothetical protein
MNCASLVTLRQWIQHGSGCHFNGKSKHAEGDAMKSKHNLLAFTWLGSIILPVGIVGFLLFLDRHHPPDGDEWFTVAFVTGAIFVGIWILYFFLTWITGNRLPEGSKLNRSQVALRIVVIAVFVAAAICGLLLWVFYAMIGHGWSEAIH